MSEDIYSAIEYLQIQKTAIKLHEKYCNDQNINEDDIIEIQGEYFSFYSPLDGYTHCVRGTLIGPYTIFFAFILFVLAPLASIFLGVLSSIYDSIAKKCKHIKGTVDEHLPDEELNES